MSNTHHLFGSWKCLYDSYQSYEPSGECDTFNENNMTFDLVKLHLIKGGPGLPNSYESYDSFKWWNCISLEEVLAWQIRTSRTTRSSGETASY